MLFKNEDTNKNRNSSSYVSSLNMIRYMKLYCHTKSMFPSVTFSKNTDLLHFCCIRMTIYLNIMYVSDEHCIEEYFYSIYQWMIIDGIRSIWLLY
ncbi:unnamed protein product [Rotaria magnacalcarata]